MPLYSLIGFTAVAAVMSYSVRQLDPQAGRSIALAAAAFILLTVLGSVSGVLSELSALAGMGGIGDGTLLAVMKAVGIAYLTKLTASLCRDLGESSLAAACEFTGRILLIVLALPIVRSIAEMLIDLIESAL